MYTKTFKLISTHNQMKIQKIDKYSFNERTRKIMFNMKTKFVLHQ